jgi:hypothetical protein
MSKSPRPPIPFRPDHTGAASVRAFGLAVAIARARERQAARAKGSAVSDRRAAETAQQKKG